MSLHPQTESYKFWTSEEEIRLSQLVNSNKSFHEIGKLLNRTGSSCQCRAKRIGLKNNYIHRTHSRNEDFWAVPNPINCYWAGFSAADASITDRGNGHYSYRLEIQKADEAHLKKLLIETDSSSRIMESIRPKYNSHNVAIQIHCDKWGNDLREVFNIAPNKAKRLGPPNLASDYLFLCWLIGYTDGDGTIHKNKINQVFVNYVSASQGIIEWLKTFTDKVFYKRLRNTQNEIYKNLRHECWHLSITGVRALAVISYLRTFPVPKLSRKWDQPEILALIEEKKKEFPHLFIPPVLQTV